MNKIQYSAITGYYLSSEIYMTISECDCMIVCGDFSARIGNLSDCIIDSSIISRSSIDKTTNKQGYDLIEFLQEMRMCTLNGRFEHDNFTCTSSRGKSVVD